MTNQRNQIHELLNTIVNTSGADETQVTLSGGKCELSLFGNNLITNNHMEKWHHLRIKVAYQRQGQWRVGIATGNRIDEEGIAQLLVWAEENASLEAPRSQYLPLPDPQLLQSVLPEQPLSHDTATANASAIIRTSDVSDMIFTCRRLGHGLHGHYGISEGSFNPTGEMGIKAIANSRGLFQYFSPTHAYLKVLVTTGRGGLGRIDTLDHNLAALATGEQINRAIKDAELPARSYSVGTSNPMVLLEAPAVARLLDAIKHHFSWRHVRSRQSDFRDNLGQQIFSPDFSLSLQPTHTLLQERSFGPEGCPRHEVRLIGEGILEQFLYTRIEAQDMEVDYNGYLSDEEETGRVDASHLVMSGTTNTTESLLEEMNSGILIRRFDNPLEIDHRRLEIRGRLQRDAFLVTGRQPTAALINLTFRINLRELLNQIIAIGQQVRVKNMVTAPILTSSIEFQS
jgi:predicted Zn-dependent protease